MPHSESSDSITILHAADIHLDSPLRGLSRLRDRQLEHNLRLATSRAFERLVDLAVERKVDAVVLAGDLYDGDSKDYGTARFFAAQMGKLADVGIPVVMVAGNHDAASEITKSLVLPDNVTSLSTGKPETKTFDDLGLAVHGQGFAERVVMENLASKYPNPYPDMVNVGLLHTSVSGYSGHDPYAPCSVADLQSKGYEYFALGHVHMREVLCTEGTTAAFSGNLQGRHVRETGPKGVYLATLRPGEQAELEFVVLDVARWESLEIDLTEATDYSDVVSRAKGLLTTARTESGKRPLVARLTLVGATEVASELTDSVQVREDLEAVAERLGVALEKIRNRTRIPEVAPGLAAAHQDKLAEIAQSADFDEAAISKLLVKVRSATSAPLRELGIDGDVSLAEVPALALERLKSEFGGEA